MSDYPLISIITPVYNGGYPFVCCLLAISQSKCDNWELIIIDDGSTDKSALIAEKFAAKLLKTSGREGPGAARNLGAKAAKGEGVAESRDESIGNRHIFKFQVMN